MFESEKEKVGGGGGSIALMRPKASETIEFASSRMAERPMPLEL